MQVQERVRQAIILVGGAGKRLGHLTMNTPKPLMPIDNDVVFLDLVIKELARQGFSEVVLLAGYLSEQIQEKYQDLVVFDAKIDVVVEEAALGTAGALLQVKDRLAPLFMVLNGDSYFEFNFRKLESELYANQKAIGAIALRHCSSSGRYGNVILDDSGKIQSFLEKTNICDKGTAMMNGGIYMFRRGITDFIDGQPCSMEYDVFPALAQSGLLRGQVGDGYFIDIGLPSSLETCRNTIGGLSKRPALFLDRDGVLNLDRGYTHQVEDLVWVDGAKETILQANNMGFRVLVVTNQAGIARGYYSEQEMHAFHERMNNELAMIGAFIDKFYYCPFHAKASILKFRQDNHSHRKPNAGMLLDAISEWDVDVEKSFLVGDNWTDIEAAKAVGVEAYLFTGGSLFEFCHQRIYSVACDD